MCFSFSLFVWMLVDATGSTTGYLVLTDQNEVVVTIWVWTTVVYGYCIPQSVWDVCYLDSSLGGLLHLSLVRTLVHNLHLAPP